MNLASFFFAWGILVPWARIDPMLPAVEVQSLNHWTARQVPIYHLLLQNFYLSKGKEITVERVKGSLTTTSDCVLLYFHFHRSNLVLPYDIQQHILPYFTDVSLFFCPRFILSILWGWRYKSNLRFGFLQADRRGRQHTWIFLCRSVFTKLCHAVVSVVSDSMPL